MTEHDGPDRFHRRVGWIAAIGFWFLLGLPALVIVTIGDCLTQPDAEYAACAIRKRIGFFVVLLGSPLIAAAVGWIAYRYSRFLG